MNKKITAVAVVALAALAGAGVAGARMMLNFTMNGNRQTLEEALAWQADHYDISFIDVLKRETYTINSFDDYVLHVEYFENPVPSDHYIILSHGITDNRYGDLKYMKMYLDMGFNCIAYDLRGHGENESTWCSYSIRESADLSCLINDTYERYGEDIVLGLHGESLGAATTVAVLGKTQRPAFAVLDCPFSEIESVLKGTMKSAHFPTCLIDIVGFLSKQTYGYSFKEMVPMNVLPENEVPTLFIHGDKDSLISPEHSQRMSQMTGGYSEVHLMPGAEHAQSVLKDPEAYADIVKNFLTKINV